MEEADLRLPMWSVVLTVFCFIRSGERKGPSQWRQAEDPEHETTKIRHTGLLSLPLSLSFCPEI